MYYCFELLTKNETDLDLALEKHAFKFQQHCPDSLSIEGTSIPSKEYAAGVMPHRAHLHIIKNGTNIITSSNPIIEVFAHYDVPTDWSTEGFLKSKDHKTDHREKNIQDHLKPVIDDWIAQNLVQIPAIYQELEQILCRRSNNAKNLDFYHWLEKKFHRIRPGKFQNIKNQGIQTIWVVEQKKFFQLVAQISTPPEFYSFQWKEYEPRFSLLELLNQEAFCDGLVDYLNGEDRWYFLNENIYGHYQEMLPKLVLYLVSPIPEFHEVAETRIKELIKRYFTDYGALQEIKKLFSEMCSKLSQFVLPKFTRKYLTSQTEILSYLKEHETNSLLYLHQTKIENKLEVLVSHLQSNDLEEKECAAIGLERLNNPAAIFALEEVKSQLSESLRKLNIKDSIKRENLQNVYERIDMIILKLKKNHSI